MLVAPDNLAQSRLAHQHSRGGGWSHLWPALINSCTGAEEMTLLGSFWVEGWPVNIQTLLWVLVCIQKFKETSLGAFFLVMRFGGLGTDVCLTRWTSIMSFGIVFVQQSSSYFINKYALVLKLLLCLINGHYWLQ